MANTTRADARIASRRIPKDARCILEHENGSALYVYEVAGRLYAIAFWGTAGKSLEHYSYRTEERRNEAILRFKTSVEQSIALRASEKAKNAARVNTLHIGDIVNTSWGYDQTNVEFYVVTRVSPARVWVRRIASDYEADSSMSGRCWPAMPIQMVGTETMHVAKGEHCSIDGHRAHKTTGATYTSSYA